ncbi:hypothetical protein ACQ4PT_031155 [Festuca glaucescens]
MDSDDEEVFRKLQEAVEELTNLEVHSPDNLDKENTEAAVWVPMEKLEEEAKEFDSNYPFRMMEMKMHRFPASLRAGLGDQYVVPLVVAIGPYHHGLPRLQEMETVKRVAAYHFIRNSGFSDCYEHFYQELFLPVAYRARSLYAEDAVAGIDAAEFAAMMFRDACFLLQYMVVMKSTSPISTIHDFEEDELFPRFLFSNRASINNDIMLLENQLPWQVFYFLMGGDVPFGCETEYESPSRSMMGSTEVASRCLLALRSSQESASGSRPAKLQSSWTWGSGWGPSMRNSSWPHYLDGLRACWLVNMAALELSMTSSFSEGTASVCSYMSLLAMLMSREEDVHLVRGKRFLQGELTDKQMLSFFNTITEHISPGRAYFEILADIEACKRRRWLAIMVYRFISDNSKTIATVLSVIGVLVGIFKTLFSLKEHQQ